MKLEEKMNKEMRANQKKLAELGVRMELLFGTPRALTKEVKAEILEHQDRVLFYLKELELQGQRFKIHNMEAVISLLTPKT